MITSFLDLAVYKEAVELTIQIEHLIRSFPKHEQFLLVDQMRRASRTIGPLIAEGYAKRRFIKNFRKYINDAIGEANEMVAHLEIAGRLNYIKTAELKELTTRYDILGRKLNNLQSSWQNFK